jgi:alpha-tubulin suppressor-like RCC1 family protein
VVLPERVRGIAAGMHFSLALGDSGHVYAWGWNAKGQLGLGDMDDRYFASRLSGLERVEAITAGETYAVALKSHRLFGWGNNESGQLGRADRLQARPMQFFPAG